MKGKLSYDSAVQEEMAGESTREILNALSEGIIMQDLEGKITWMNEAAQRILSLDGGKMAGQDLYSVLVNDLFIEPGQFPGGQDPFLQAMHDCDPKSLRVHLPGYRQQPVLLSFNIRPLYDSKGGNVSGVLTSFQHFVSDLHGSQGFEESSMKDKIEMQREITRAILHAQEAERSRIGRELHDNVNQMLASINLYLCYMRQEKRFKEEILDNCRSCVVETIEEIRKMTKGLVVPVSRFISLKDSLEDLLVTVGEVSRIEFSMRTKSLNEAILTADCKQNLFRIVQEQLNNIIKYSGAGKVTIELSSRALGTELIISDDGRGFNVKSQRKGSGLMNIRHRAEAFNGHAEFISSPGKGCTLKVMLPSAMSA